MIDRSKLDEMLHKKVPNDTGKKGLSLCIRSGQLAVVQLAIPIIGMFDGGLEDVNEQLRKGMDGGATVRLREALHQAYPGKEWQFFYPGILVPVSAAEDQAKDMLEYVQEQLDKALYE